MIYDIPVGGDGLSVAWSIGLRTEYFSVIYGYGWTGGDLMIIDLLSLLIHYFSDVKFIISLYKSYSQRKSSLEHSSSTAGVLSSRLNHSMQDLMVNKSELEQVTLGGSLVFPCYKFLHSHLIHSVYFLSPTLC